MTRLQTKTKKSVQVLVEVCGQNVVFNAPEGGH